MIPTERKPPKDGVSRKFQKLQASVNRLHSVFAIPLLNLVFWKEMRVVAACGPRQDY